MPAEDDGGPAAATVSADLDLGSLEVREGTGGALPLTDRDRREIKKQMGQILAPPPRPSPRPGLSRP